MASETIEDIVREMRYMADISDNGYCVQFCNEFADRIESADMRLEHEMNDLCDENARLRAALKPVLECDLSKFGDGFCYADLFESVLDAQRIYNESEAKR